MLDTAQDEIGAEYAWGDTALPGGGDGTGPRKPRRRLGWIIAWTVFGAVGGLATILVVAFLVLLVAFGNDPAGAAGSCGGG